MIAVLRALGWIVVSRFKSRERLEAGNLALRHQFIVLRRSAPLHLRFLGSDRLLFVWLYRLWPGVLNAIVIVKPETVVRWHRRGFKVFWRWKSRGRPGRPRIPPEVRDLIREVSLANPLWGAPRIHGELLKVGIDVARSTVAQYMVKGRRPPSQSWKTFLRNHADGIASVDFFVVPTVAFKLLFGFVIMLHDRRRLVHIREAFPWDTAPQYLIRDRDGAYGQSFRSTVMAMGVQEVVTAPRSPWQIPYVERLIGSVRRECLNHMIVLNERHLRRILVSYLDYYHRSRTHLSLGKDTPEGRSVQPHGTGRIVAFPQVGGLHHRYERLAA